MDLDLPVVASLLSSEPLRDPPDTILIKLKDLLDFLELALESTSLPDVLRCVDQLLGRGKVLLLTLSSVLLREWKVLIRLFLVPSSIVCKSSVAFDSFVGMALAMLCLDPLCFVRSLSIFFSATTWFCKMR